MGDDAGVAAACREPDAVQRLGHRSDLVQFNQYGIGDAVFNAFRKNRGIGHENVVAHDLDEFVQAFGHQDPIVPILFGQPVLNG